VNDANERAGPGTTIHVSLISHTNAGKTTLARTLLKRDVGEVRDLPHVTDMAESHPMIESEGAALTLWDTPGFGDTARLIRRLRHANDPLGWILTQVWDRFVDRPLWCSQQAVRNARDQADLVLYLVNAAEDPRDAGYVEMEMQILAWIGKPVILLLNQMGPPTSAADEAAQLARWRTHVQRFEVVGGVLALDAFARCWVQEEVLLEAIARLVGADKQAALAQLARAWHEDNLARFHTAMEVLAAQLARAIVDREVLGTRTLTQQMRAFVQAVGLSRGETPGEKELAMAALATRLDADTRKSTDALIRLHGLEGHAAAEVLRRLQAHYTAHAPVSERVAALLGGLASGAMGGLAADLAAGGLTFGAGVVGGSIAGAVGAAGLARGYNLVRGEREAAVRWSAEFVVGLARAALLRYLAVAHYGRGRGEWVESEHPKFWQRAVERVVEERREEMKALWAQGKSAANEKKIAREMKGVLTSAGEELLRELYPQYGGTRGSAE
jgi:hypothetical protein